MQQQSNETGGNPAGVVLAWTIVTIPLLWGIYNTFLNVVKLAHSGS